MNLSLREQGGNLFLIDFPPAGKLDRSRKNRALQ